MALEGEFDRSAAERLDSLHKRLTDELRVKMDEDKMKLAQKSGKMKTEATVFAVKRYSLLIINKLIDILKTLQLFT